MAIPYSDLDEWRFLLIKIIPPIIAILRSLSGAIHLERNIPFFISSIMDPNPPAVEPSHHAARKSFQRQGMCSMTRAKVALTAEVMTWVDSIHHVGLVTLVVFALDHSHLSRLLFGPQCQSLQLFRY
jgi:hypothetical protein